MNVHQRASRMTCMALARPVLPSPSKGAPENVERERATADNRDWTRYVITVAGHELGA